MFNVNNNCSSGSTALMMARLLILGGYECSLAVGKAIDLLLGLIFLWKGSLGNHTRLESRVSVFTQAYMHVSGGIWQPRNHLLHIV